MDAGLFTLEGYRLILECVTSGYPIEKIWMGQQFADSQNGMDVIAQIEDLEYTWEIAPAEQINRITETKHGQEILAVLALPDTVSQNISAQRILVLDQVNDPGNLGTLLRTAAWFGIKSVVISENSVDPFNPKVVRSAMGAHFHLQILEKDLISVIPALVTDGYALFGGVVDGDDLETAAPDPEEKWALVLGNEARGISPEIQKLLTKKLTITGLGNIESLNLSIAGGILLHWLTRLRLS